MLHAGLLKGSRLSGSSRYESYGRVRSIARSLFALRQHAFLAHIPLEGYVDILYEDSPTLIFRFLSRVSLSICSRSFTGLRMGSLDPQWEGTEAKSSTERAVTLPLVQNAELGLDARYT